MVSLFVLFGGLFDWFACFGGGISLFGVVWYFWFLVGEVFVGLVFLLISYLVWNCGVRNKTKKIPWLRNLEEG